MTGAGDYLVTILGCGSSGGVPRIGNDWGACDPNEPRNRRTRCSALIERGATSVLIDTAPDMREQLLRTGTRTLDGVLFTHDHADQSHGIDDLRMLALNRRRRVDVYMDAPTSASLRRRFDYCFETPPGSSYPPILTEHRLKAFEPISIQGEGGPIHVLPVDQDHGDIRSLGFRIGGFAYSPDLVGLPEESFEAFADLDCWVVDALRYRPHPSHAHLELALEWIARLRPRRAFLTNLHVDLDYATLVAQLPPGVAPAYDGLQIRIEA